MITSKLKDNCWGTKGHGMTGYENDNTPVGDLGPSWTTVETPNERVYTLKFKCGRVSKAFRVTVKSHGSSPVW